MMKSKRVAIAIRDLDEEGVERLLCDCLARRFGAENLGKTDYWPFILSLPQGYRVLIPTTWIEGQVSNGGIGQYFWNRLVDYAPMTSDAIEAYSAIGATDQAEAVRECVRAFKPLEAKCRKIRNALGSDGFWKWMAIWDSLEFRGDKPFFEYERITCEFRVPWIRKNTALFDFE